MADYTDAEIQAAVEKVVRSNIRRLYGFLGNRDTKTTFDDLQDATAGLFLLRPNAPFYVVWLGVQRLRELLDPLREVVGSLVEDVRYSDRATTKIERLEPLANAMVALNALSQAAAKRDGFFESIDDIPAYKRYNTNVDRFLSESSSNIRYRGAIVPTPQEARAEIPGLVRDLKSQHAEIVARVDYLSRAIDDYDALQLPALLAEGTVSRARQVLSDRYDELVELSPEARLEKIRDVTLDMLAGRAAVRSMTSLKSTTMFAALEGDSQPSSDLSHPATPATTGPQRYGPFAIFFGSNMLYIRTDGDFYFAVTVPGAFLANISGVVVEPYTIVAGQNDELSIVMEDSGVTTIPVLFPVSVPTWTAEDIAGFINTEIGLAYPGHPTPPGPIVAEPAVGALRYSGTADMQVASDADFVISGLWSDFGVVAGDWVKIEIHATPAQEGSWYQVDTVAGDTISCTLVSGPAPVADSNCQVRVGTGRVVRVRINDGNELDALNGRWGFSFGAPANGAAFTLGFVPNGAVYSRSVSADLVVRELNSSYAAQYLGRPRLETEVVFTPVWEGLGRTNPDDPARLIAYKFREYGSVGSGTLVTFSVPGALTAGVIVNDIAVIRETVTPGDMDVFGTVTVVGDSSITVDFGAHSVTAGDVLVEVGPDFRDGAQDAIQDKLSGMADTKQYLGFRISGSATQDGDFVLARGGYLTIPFEFGIEGGISNHRGEGGLPQFFDLALGLKGVRFGSTTTFLDTKIEIFDAPQAPPPPAGPENYTCHDKFFSGPVSAVGSTKYFLLPDNPGSLSVGDTLEIHETNYAVPSRVMSITGLELGLLLIEIDPEIETDFGTISMGGQVPFARIRLVRKNTYTVLEEALLEWLEKT